MPIRPWLGQASKAIVIPRPPDIPAIPTNIATATKLATPRTIAGTSFDGSANIDFTPTQKKMYPAPKFLQLTGATGCGVPAPIVTAGGVNYLVMDFDKDAIEYAVLWDILPGNYNGGTFTYQVLWTTAGTTGNVIWTVAMRAFGDSDALDQAYGTAVDVTDTFITAGDVHVSPVSAAVTCAGTPLKNKMFSLLLSRKATDGGDTHDADARFMGLILGYTADALAEA